MPSLYAARRELLFPSDSVEATRPNLTKLKRLTHRHIGKATFKRLYDAEVYGITVSFVFSSSLW